LQHLSYPSQLAAKTAILQDTFTRIGGFSPPAPIVASSSPWEYRNRMQFHQQHSNQAIKCPESGVSWGLKARKSADIIPINDCPIADPGIRDILRGKTPLLLPEKNRFTVFSRNGVLLSEGGIQQGKIKLLDKELTIDIGVFFQSNSAMLEKMLSDLREIVSGMNHAKIIDQNLPMADLYCGIGTFGAFLGELFPHIDLIEEQETALALARENLKSEKSAAYYAQSSENWAKTGLSGKKGRPYGFIIVDPPRQGLAPALAQQLAKDGPPLLAYVSCDPANLARDSKILREGGYTLKELRWYDFYPQSSHIESLALFAR
jgi:23S rRNA (uracil1939-C5)-methyltransferase